MRTSEYRSGRPARPGVTALAIVVASVVALTACGSSDSGNSSPTTAGSASSASGTDVDSTLAAAQKALAQLQTRPTQISITTPIGKPVPTGITVYFVNCGATSCNDIAKVWSKAAQVLGWTFKNLPTDGTPGQIQNAWQQVIRDKPFAAITVGTPLPQIATYTAAAHKNGTFIVAGSVPESSAPNIDWLSGSSAESQAFGSVLAPFVATDAAAAGYKNPRVLFVDLPDFPTLADVGTGFKNELKTYCPSCGVDELDIGFASLAQAPDMILSYLRSHPQVKYVLYSAAGAMDSATGPIAASGLKVKVIASTPTSTTLVNVKAGSVAAVSAFPQYEQCFSVFDAIARKAAGVPVLPSSPKPKFLVTKANIPGTEIFPIVPDAVAQFTKLWGK